MFHSKVSPRWSKMLFHILPVGLSTGLLLAYILGLPFLLGSDQVAFSTASVLFLPQIQPASSRSCQTWNLLLTVPLVPALLHLPLLVLLCRGKTQARWFWFRFHVSCNPMIGDTDSFPSGWSRADINPSFPLNPLADQAVPYLLPPLHACLLHHLNLPNLLVHQVGPCQCNV